MKGDKLDRIAGILKPQYRGRRTGDRFDCLDDDLRRRAGIVDTANVSDNPYHLPALQLFARHQRGLVADIGAGKRTEQLSHVVNVEVVPYDSTDVLAASESLPFEDEVFDAVHSNAVLEHVKDPFACAAEMLRVLKPGGELMCCVPFLQPYHGYPNHYYNMTHQGLANLFPGVEVLGVDVYEELRPITALQWIIGAWASGRSEQSANEFLDLRLRDIVARPYHVLAQARCVVELPPAKNHELASASTLFARKPDARESAPLEIVRAAYGTRAGWLDATAVVRGLAGRDRLFISCARSLEPLFGDPAPGAAKELRGFPASICRTIRQCVRGALGADRLKVPSAPGPC